MTFRGEGEDWPDLWVQVHDDGTVTVTAGLSHDGDDEITFGEDKETALAELEAFRDAVNRAIERVRALPHTGDSEA